MKRLRWYDFIFINLFWIGLNIRNTAVGIVFQPYLVEKYAPGDWKNTALSIMSNGGSDHRHAGPTSYRVDQRPLHLPLRTTPTLYPLWGLA